MHLILCAALSRIAGHRAWRKYGRRMHARQPSPQAPAAPQNIPSHIAAPQCLLPAMPVFFKLASGNPRWKSLARFALMRWQSGGIGL
jgi:hypothetical protein